MITILVKTGKGKFNRDEEQDDSDSQSSQNEEESSEKRIEMVEKSKMSKKIDKRRAKPEEIRAESKLSSNNKRGTSFKRPSSFDKVEE